MSTIGAISAAYGRVAQVRRAWYGRHPHAVRSLARPVISVGNLVVGGSGKTPVVAALARLLQGNGERPAIVSRGYGRRRSSPGALLVSDGVRVLEPTERSGDEPQMLARALRGVPVVVAADRHLAGTLAERRLGCTVHVLDDGFQHLQLARDVNLLLVSRADLEERVLPAGRLRERLDASAAADAVLVSGTEDDVAAVAAALRQEVVFRVVPRYGAPRLVRPYGDPAPPSGCHAVAFAGIARPARFFDALRAQGWDVVREIAFRDHHWFTERDLRTIAGAADEMRADIVLTTEKDAVRLEAPTVHAWAYVPMEVAIEPAGAFDAWLTHKLHVARTFKPGPVDRAFGGTS